MYGIIDTCTSISITIPGVIAYVYGIQGHRICLFSLSEMNSMMEWLLGFFILG